MKNTNQLISELENGKYDALLEEIYVDKSMTGYQKERYEKAVKQYQSIFGDGDVMAFSAPGRSEVCGNHTDHQFGMVLATSVNLDTIAIVGKNEKDEIRVVSDGYAMITVSLKNLKADKKEEGTSLSLIKGVLEGLQGKGYKIGGFDAYMTSNVIVGAGLSSSASFEVMIGTIISGMFNDMKIDPVEIAIVSQYAEREYFGKPCGLMDQMACSIGGMIHIDFRDVTKPVVNKVSSDFEANDYSLCIVDTKGSHADLTDDYAMVPAEMKKVAGYFGKPGLREVEEKEFYKNIPVLREKFGDRPVLRAIHFFEEEKNVKNAVDSLNHGEFSKFLQVIKKSGDSSFKYLQNVYTNKDIEHQNVSVALAVSESILKDHGVCRVHGGGFAGTIQAFVKNDFVSEYKKEMEAVFGEDACHILKVRKYGGMKVME